MKNNSYFFIIFISLWGIIFSSFQTTAKTKTPALLFNFDSDVLVSGGIKADQIPSLDTSTLISVTKARYKSNERIHWIRWKGKIVGFPEKILIWHELIHFKIYGEPFVITFCPFSGTALAFHRKIKGQTLSFGVAGSYYNSNLVFFDRQSASLWSQIPGQCFQGSLQGKKLRPIQIQTLSFHQFLMSFPKAKILSPITGFHFPYSRYPYKNYRKNRRLFFPVSHRSGKLHPKTEIIGIQFGKKSYAVPVASIPEISNFSGDINALEKKLENKKIIIKKSPKGIIFVKTTDEKNVYFQRMFWFSWITFHPNSILETSGLRIKAKKKGRKQ